MHGIPSGELELLGAEGMYDVMGDVEMIGDDYASLLEAMGDEGAAKASRRAMARGMAVAREIDPEAMAVKQQVYRNLAFQVAGFPATVFPIATPTQTISLQVVRPFKPSDFFVSSTQAAFFQLDSATINGNNQLMGNGPAPLDMFSTGSFRSKFRWQTVNTSSPLVLGITMIDLTVQRTLRGAFIGASLLKG